MQRRDFIKTAGVVGLSAAWQSGSLAVAADAPAVDKPALSIRQVENDHFRMDFAPSQPRPLRVLQITDTHFGNDDPWAKLQDQRTFKSLKRLVDQQRPDFLVHTGDFINNDKGSKISFEAIEVFDDLGVPWTHALGNHDIGHRSVPEFRQSMRRASVGEFQAQGAAHYAFRFDVMSPDKTEPAYTIFCFDSGFRDPNRRVSQPQLEWLANVVRRDAERGANCPALAMIHIPVVEFETLRAAGKQQGNYGEAVCFDNDHGDTFTAFKKSGRIKGVFSGHDHKNDYHGAWDGIELAYGRVGGWSAYGELERGGRLIEIDLAAQTFSHALVFPDLKQKS